MFSMLGIVLANNFAMMFIFWELVGVSSYLLIGHWFTRDTPRRPLTRPLSPTGSAISDSCSASSWWWSAYLQVRWSSARSRPACQSQPAQSQPDRRLPHALDALLIFCGAIGKSCRSSRSTSGCPTPWKAPRPFPRSSTPRRWWLRASTCSPGFPFSSSSPPPGRRSSPPSASRLRCSPRSSPRSRMTSSASLPILRSRSLAT